MVKIQCIVVWRINQVEGELREDRTSMVACFVA